MTANKKIAFAVNIGIVLAILSVFAITHFFKATSSALYIYMCGSTLESTQGIASRNITELLEADLPPNMNIIIQTGGASRWRSHGISSKKIARYQIKNHELVELETLGQASMGSEATFSDFVSFASTNYPARKKMLIIWNHGGGTLQGACFDENYSNDKLTIPEMQSGLERGLSGDKLFALGFDACLMADIEVARAVAPSANMLIASQAIENGEGWDYIRLVKDLARSGDMNSFGQKVCDGYYEKSEKSQKEAAVTLSAVDLRSFNKVSDAFDELGQLIDKEIDEVDTRTYLMHSLQISGSYGLDKDGKANNLYDLLSFVDNVKDHASGEVVQQAEALGNEIRNAIIYNKTGNARQNSTGMSMFYPLRYTRSEVDDFLAINQSEPWNNIVSKMYTQIPDETIGLEDKGSIEDGLFYITLTPQSFRYLREIRFILMYEGDDTPIPLVARFDLMQDLDYNNPRIQAFLPKTMFSLNGTLIHTSQVDISSDDEMYASMLMRNNEIIDFRFARVKEEDIWKCYPLGIVNYDETLGVPKKDYAQLKEGDVVRINGKNITIGPEGAVVEEIPLKDGRYTYQLVCVDIFGKLLSSKTLSMEYHDGEWSNFSIKDN